MIERQIVVFAWIVAAIIGAFVQVLLILDERRSLKVLKRQGRNGEARLVAWEDIRTDACVFVVMLIVLTMGIVAYIVVNRGSPPYSAVEAWALAQFWRVLGYGVLVSILILVVKNVMKRQSRHRLLKPEEHGD